jgi:hypothetical protein
LPIITAVAEGHKGRGENLKATKETPNSARAAAVKKAIEQNHNAQASKEPEEDGKEDPNQDLQPPPPTG